MFGKLKNKLKKWAEKVSKIEESPKKIENVKESKENLKNKKRTKKKNPNNKIDIKLKEELKNGNYLEPPEKFVPAMMSYQPRPDTTPKLISSQIQKKEGKTEGVTEKSEKIIKKKTPFLKNVFSGKKIISKDEFNNYSEELEMNLLENNVALKIAEKIINELREEITEKELSKKEIEITIKNSLKKIISKILLEPFNIIEEIKNKKAPYVVIFCGINGAGKTTAIAKFAYLLKKKGISSVLAAGDTFRAAAVEQLREHGKNLNVKVISHDYGSDPASVGFDAIKYAEKNQIQVVLIDTAGRIHTAKNLLQEMEKIKRVCKPDRTIFLGEAITGNDSVDQVRAFDDAIGIDGIILSKADIDEKGGTALSIGYATKKPILYLGTGQDYEDLEPFNKKNFIEKLGID